MAHPATERLLHVDGARDAAGQGAQAVEELRRLVDVEVGIEHGDAKREPVEVVVAGAVLASLAIDRLDAPPGDGDAPAHRLGRGVDRHPRLVPVGRRGDALRDVRRGVLRGRLARSEARTSRGRPRQAIDPKGPPVAATAVPGQEVPPPAEVDERVRLDLAATLRAVAAAVEKAQTLGVAAPVDLPPVRVAVLSDPQGAVFSVNTYQPDG